MMVEGTVTVMVVVKLRTLPGRGSPPNRPCYPAAQERVGLYT